LSATTLLNQKEDLLSRKIGDDYLVLLGPSRFANTDAIRQALTRFVIDAIIERHLKASLEFKDPLFVMLARSWPDYDKLRTDSRFLEIVDRLNLPGWSATGSTTG
jgi:hypothetical protein